MSSSVITGLAVVGFVRLGDVAILTTSPHLTDALVADPAVVLVACTWWNFRSWSSVVLYTRISERSTRPNAIEPFKCGTHNQYAQRATDIPSLSSAAAHLLAAWVPPGRFCGWWSGTAEGRPWKVGAKDRGRDVGIRARKGAGNATQRLQCAANRSLLRLRRAFARISHLARGAAGNQVLRIGRSCGRCSHSGEYQGADSESDHWPRLAAGNTLGW